VQFHLLVASSLDRGECFALRPRRLTLVKKIPGLLCRRVDRGGCFALSPGRLTHAEKIPGTVM